MSPELIGLAAISTITNSASCQREARTSIGVIFGRAVVGDGAEQEKMAEWYFNTQLSP